MDGQPSSAANFRILRLANPLRRVRRSPASTTSFCVNSPYRRGRAGWGRPPLDVSAERVIYSHPARRDHRPDDLPFGHQVEGLVDLVEADPTGDHPSEIESARFGQGDEKREISPDLTGAVVAANQTLLCGEQLVSVE